MSKKIIFRHCFLYNTNKGNCYTVEISANGDGLTQCDAISTHASCPNIARPLISIVLKIE